MSFIVERLESRKCFDATLDSNGVLTVVGTRKDDVIVLTVSVTQNGDFRVQVGMNRRSQFFPFNDVESVRFHGRRGDDNITVPYPFDFPIRISGEGGNDFLETVGPAARMYGGSGNDTIRGHFGVDTIFGGAGDDLLGGRFNRDKVYGEDGNDTLYGSEAADQLDGGAGNDLLKGDAGRDVLRDTAGQNTLLGGDGDDRLFNGPSATGTMTGGAGADRFSDAGDASDFLANEDDPDPLPDPLA